MLRVLIFGSRDYCNAQRVLDELTALQDTEGVKVVIEGEAKGADTLGRLAAEQLNIPVVKFPANWKVYGRAAGSIRNQQQLDEGKPNYYLGFSSHWETSKGSLDMLQRLTKAKVNGKVITEG